MVMQEISDNEEMAFEGGQYASTEAELYEKAIALLEMCKIETRRTGQKRRVGTVISPNTLTKEHPDRREQADGDGYGGARGPQDVAFPA